MCATVLAVIYSDNLTGQTKLQNSSEILGNEFNGYLEDRISFSDHWDTTVGLHYSHFAIGEKSYDSFQLRVHSAFQFNRWAIKLSSTSYLFSAESYWRKMNHIITYQSRESFFKMNEKWYGRTRLCASRLFWRRVVAV